MAFERVAPPNLTLREEIFMRKYALEFDDYMLRSRATNHDELLLERNRIASIINSLNLEDLHNEEAFLSGLSDVKTLLLKKLEFDYYTRERYISYLPTLDEQIMQQNMQLPTRFPGQAELQGPAEFQGQTGQSRIPEGFPEGFPDQTGPRFPGQAGKKTKMKKRKRKSKQTKQKSKRTKQKSKKQYK